MGSHFKRVFALAVGLCLVVVACTESSPSGLANGASDLLSAETRFEVDADQGLVTDTATGRTWLRSTPAIALSWTLADQFCQARQMRLPTVGELALLITASSGDDDCALDDAFEGDCGQHWSSEQTTAPKPSDKWEGVDFFTVHMSQGELAHRFQDEVSATRCVRDTESLDVVREEPMSQIGSTLWMRSSSGVAVFHKAAEEACGSLCYGGNCDWRLPTRDELVDLTLGAADDCMMPSSLDGPCASYWSATQSSSVTAYQVDFEHGLVDEVGVEEWAHFRCVSDVQ